MTTAICVWYWVIFLPYVYAGRYIVDFVNKTSRD